MIQMNLSVKQEEDQRHREETGCHQGEGGWERDGFGV